jgi:hypothetical protein
MIAAGILDNQHVELLKGEIVEMYPEGEPHAYTVRYMTFYCVSLFSLLVLLYYTPIGVLRVYPDRYKI